jgi:dihydroneopterin aldolase
MAFKITLKNIKIISNHGCLEEEELIGSEYVLNIEVQADLTKSALTDNLVDTIDYVDIYNIGYKHTIRRKKLLEPVIQAICDEILHKYPMAQSVHGELQKINPPIGGDVEYVSVSYMVSK